MDLRQLTDDVETVSQRYAEAFSFDRDDAWFLLKLQEEVGELTQAFLMPSGQARTKGLTPAELDANFRAEMMAATRIIGSANRLSSRRASRISAQRFSPGVTRPVS